MKGTEVRKLVLLEVLFAVLMVVSNVVNEKVIVVGPMLLPGSAFIYVITFFISNLITEWYSKDEAIVCLKQGIACNLIATILYIIIKDIPAQDPNMQEAYVLLLGTNWVFVAADIIACVVSQYGQILVFDRLRCQFSGQVGNFVSMTLSQMIDTFIFLGIAFGLGSLWFMSSDGRSMFLNMFLSQYAIKIIIALVLTLVFKKLLPKELKGVRNEPDFR